MVLTMSLKKKKKSLSTQCYKVARWQQLPGEIPLLRSSEQAHNIDNGFCGNSAATCCHKSSPISCSNNQKVIKWILLYLYQKHWKNVLLFAKYLLEWSSLLVKKFHFYQELQNIETLFYEFHTNSTNDLGVQSRQNCSLESELS